MWKNKLEKARKFITELFSRYDEELDIEKPEIDWVEFAKKRPTLDSINIYDKEERERCVRNCLEQINEAAIQLEQLTFEYNMVTAYLTDMEEIEGLPEEQKKELEECAKKVLHLDNENTVYQGKKNRLTELQYRKIERIEADMPQAYDKISACEVYQNKIRHDLKRLDGEKHAYAYQKEELETRIANSKGMLGICVGAYGVCMFMLLLLKTFFEMEIQVGYLLATGVVAVAFTVIFVKHTEYRKERKRVENNMRQLILLQNKVKIRYVNNTNLLEYYCVKYDVANGKELDTLWEKFQVEKEERKKLERTQADLDFYQTELIAFLKRYRIKDTAVWLHQAEALLDSREMVEIRHSLISRRQKLRKQMSFSKEIAQGNQTDVKNLVEMYPKYAEEILKLVSEYENQYAY